MLHETSAYYRPLIGIDGAYNYYQVYRTVRTSSSRIWKFSNAGENRKKKVDSLFWCHAYIDRRKNASENFKGRLKLNILPFPRLHGHCIHNNVQSLRAFGFSNAGSQTRPMYSKVAIL